jgi:hypothetical protein
LPDVTRDLVEASRWNIPVSPQLAPAIVEQLIDGRRELRELSLGSPIEDVAPERVERLARSTQLVEFGKQLVRGDDLA